MNGHLRAILAVVLWIAMAAGPSSAAEPKGPGLREEKPSGTLSVVINLYDIGRAETLQSVIGALTPLIQPTDVFTLVSGNHRGTPDIAAICRSAETLPARFPNNDRWVLTGGLANVRILADARDRIPISV